MLFLTSSPALSPGPAHPVYMSMYEQIHTTAITEQELVANAYAEVSCFTLFAGSIYNATYIFCTILETSSGFREQQVCYAIKFLHSSYITANTNALHHL